MTSTNPRREDGPLLLAARQVDLGASRPPCAESGWPVAVVRIACAYRPAGLRIASVVCAPVPPPQPASVTHLMHQPVERPDPRGERSVTASPRCHTRRRSSRKPRQRVCTSALATCSPIARSASASDCHGLCPGQRRDEETASSSRKVSRNAAPMRIGQSTSDDDRGSRFVPVSRRRATRRDPTNPRAPRTTTRPVANTGWR